VNMRPGYVRQPRRAMHGVILLDKPLGLSSNDALQKVKRLFRAEKAGHTGTLDPLATGLLPLCFGAATKFSQVSLDADKRYTIKLGQVTTTADAEGDVIQTRPVTPDNVNAETLASACSAFLGEIEQVPPMYSALKHEGKALYEYARQGIEIERASRRVTLHSIDIIGWQDDILTLDVRCSKGTYIRTLAQDIGERLGCGAHLIGLRRTGSGGLDVAQAHTLDALQAMAATERDALLQAPDTLLVDWPEVELSQEDAGRFLSGLRRRLKLPDMDQVRVYGPLPAGAAAVAGHAPRILLGSGHVKAGELIPGRLLSPLEVQALLVQSAQPDAVQTPSPSSPVPVL